MEDLTVTRFLFWFHTGLVVAGFAGLIVAAGAAILYLLQSSQLKSRHPGKISLELPSLERLDRIHFESLSLGVVLFSLGIVVGLLWAKKLSRMNELAGDPRVILSFFTAALYWGIWAVRFSALRRGQKIAAGTVLIFILLLLTFLSPHRGIYFS
ncbi:MAG: cytochrome c biogenesis protein CcsA [Candidatus Omnitrophica bacterium]|nr:cytochrome c biogenesis protein CcsA [Candidatus Omnitrophota bacterium]